MNDRVLYTVRLIKQLIISLLSVCLTTLSIVVLLGVNALNSQSVSVDVQQFGIAEGLVNRDVQVYKDSNGFLWIVSPESLQRYDGYRFKNYPLIGGENFNPTFVAEDPKGWLCIGGLLNKKRYSAFFLHPITGKYRTARAHLGDVSSERLALLLNEKIDNNVNKKYGEYGIESNMFKVGKHDRLYFKHDQQLIIYDFTPNEVRIKLPFDASFRVETHTPNGDFWIAIEYKNEKALCRLTQEGEIKECHVAYFTKHRMVGGRISAHINGEIYFPGRDEERGEKVYSIYAINEKRERRKVYEVPEGYMFSQMVGGSVWLLGKMGWKILDLETDRIFELARADYGPELFEPLSYKTFFSDDSNQFYISSEFGFNIVNINDNPFTCYFNNQQLSLPFNNAVRGIWVDEKDVYYNCEFEGFVNSPLGQPDTFDVLLRSLPHNGEQHFHGEALYKTSKGNFLLGSVDGVYELDVNGAIQDYHTKKQQQVFYAAWSLFEDVDSCIWVGYFGLLEKICNGQVTSYPFEDSNNIIYQIKRKSAHEFWLCTNSGLYVFDKEQGQITAQYHSGIEGSQHLPVSDIRYLHLEENGDKWMATGHGLLHWNAEAGITRLFTREDGLANTNLYAAIPDEYGRLWLSSDYGLMSFDLSTYNTKTYLPEDGTGQEEYNRISYFKADDGTIFFGGLNGITSFHPKDFRNQQTDDEKMILSTIEVFDGKRGEVVSKIKEVTTNGVLEFYPDDRFIKLSFTLLNFTDISKNLYGWRIEGVYDDWTYQKDNNLQFGVLPYGNHILHIKGQGSSGSWSANELKIKIRVQKPFYLQWWFLSISLVLLILAIASFFQWRTRMLRREITKATATIQQQTEELLELDQLKSRFFANVSHELRTPLSLMLGPIRRLLKNNTVDTEGQKLLGFLERNTLHLRTLVNEILDLSKLENNKMELNEEPTLFYSYLKDHLLQYYSISDSEDIQIKVELNLDEDVQLLLDRNKFEKVLNNYLSNAIKFTRSKGSVKVKSWIKDQSLFLSVQDTGRGIHPDDLPFVYDRFYQSKTKGAVTEGGTGIGLSMCKELSELMNGDVWAESQLGKGSTFFLKLPIQLATDAVIPALTSKQVLSPNRQPIAAVLDGNKHKGKQILVVEDNKDLRAFYKIILSDYKVVATEHGQAALQYLEKNSAPDLIISDLMMPVMDGMQLLEHLKSSDTYRHLPVIMLTAKTNRAVKIKALRSGIDDYLNKPFDEEELVIRIHNLLEYRANRLIASSTETDKKENVAEQFSEADIQWLEAVENYIISQLSNDLLTTASVAAHFAMSESSLLRSLKKMTGLTPVQYLREMRLNEARNLLLVKRYKTVSQVAYQVGFKDAAAFTRSFKNRFGKVPTAYI